MTGVTATPTGGGVVLVITDRENGVSEWRRYSSHGELQEEVTARRAFEVFAMGRDGRFLAVDWPWETRENTVVVGHWSR